MMHAEMQEAAWNVKSQAPCHTQTEGTQGVDRQTGLMHMYGLRSVVS